MPKVPRKTHEKTTYLMRRTSATLGAKVKAACAQKQVSKFKRPVFSQDESRFGLWLCSKAHHCGGTKPIASVCPRCQCLYGAVEPRVVRPFIGVSRAAIVSSIF